MAGHGHEHAHEHEHGHGHAHHGHEHAHTRLKTVATETEKRQGRRLLIVLVVIAAFFVVELLGAKAAESDVLEADAYHLLMDVFALGISLGAMRVATLHPSPRFTFGLRRAEPLAALVNGALVLGVAAELVRDSIVHLAHPTMPRSGIMLMVATAALAVNGVSAWVLHGAMHAGHGHDHGHGAAAHAHRHDHDDDHGDEDDEDEGHAPPAHAHHLNLRGAWLHLLGDALGSVSAFAAGLAIRYGAPPLVDPLASFLVVAILVVGGLRLMRDAGLVLLEAAPPRLPVARIRKAVLSHPGVKSVHALHVWALGTGHDAVSVHVVTGALHAGLATKLSENLRERFAVEYATVQVEVEPTEGIAPCSSLPPPRD
jgi:cation diffusion facilitator family transporter